ncbi:MAG: right-handed parallel beta-helix repeat-containing protein [Planctomycetes bacterium]|nr:right-handed parallel beta-helix repeat-containing protein [Planctomycetota bacterium]
MADGTYTGSLNKNLYLQGKAITVRSENGSERCIIDCEGLGRGFDIDQGERRDSVIDGFTICNGRVFDNGGAIRCENAGPTITNCTITNNAAGYHAGGIYCLNGDIAVIDCTIANNEAVDNGAGISLWGGRDVVVRGCTITANVAGGRGGGIDFRHRNRNQLQCQDHRRGCHREPLGPAGWRRHHVPRGRLCGHCRLHYHEQPGGAWSWRRDFSEAQQRCHHCRLHHSRKRCHPSRERWGHRFLSE